MGKKNHDETLLPLLRTFTEGASYILQRDVANPCADKRKRYGHDLSAQETVIPSGARFVLRSIVPRDRPYKGFEMHFQQVTKGDLAIGATIADAYTYEDAPEVLIPEHAFVHGHSDRASAVALEVLRELRFEERCVATIEGLHNGYHRMPWRVLDALVTSGKVTIADVDQAVAKIMADDEKDES